MSSVLREIDNANLAISELRNQIIGTGLYDKLKITLAQTTEYSVSFDCSVGFGIRSGDGHLESQSNALEVLNSFLMEFYHFDDWTPLNLRVRDSRILFTLKRDFPIVQA